MQSIWSKSYLTFKKCNPFQASNPQKESQSLFRKIPTTVGQTKVISTSKLIESKLVVVKRKIDNEYDEVEWQKRQKTNDLKNGIDNLLSQYESNSNGIKSFSSSSGVSSFSDQSQETDSSSSCYFKSSVKTSESPKSPILNKVKIVLDFSFISFKIIYLHFFIVLV